MGAVVLIAVLSFGYNMRVPARADPSVFGVTAVGVAALAWSLLGPPAAREDPDMVTLGAGVFDAVDGVERAGEFRLEYRPDDLLLYVLKPLLGIAATTDGAAYGYAGLRVDAHVGDRLLFSPSVSLTAIHSGNGKDLGAAGVLRSGIDVSYRFDDGSRLGMSFHHMSHGKLLGDTNPGTEIVALTYSLPL